MTKDNIPGKPVDEHMKEQADILFDNLIADLLRVMNNAPWADAKQRGLFATDVIDATLDALYSFTDVETVIDRMKEHRHFRDQL